MKLTLLCIGDVVGGPGRRALREALEVSVPKYNVDCVIVNAENTAGGSGLTPALYEKICKHGANLITMGDHVYRRREIIPVLEQADNIVRPANLPRGAPGREFAVYETASHQRVAVISVLGRMYMKGPADCPFAAADRALSAIPKDVRIVVVDIHAEATSEKIAMGWYLDGRVSAVVGTHTHVPTADACVLPKGTGYITDLGMTGPYDGVLGRLKERVVSAMVTGIPTTFDVAKDDSRVCGAIIEIETATGHASAIERFEYRASSEEQTRE